MALRLCGSHTETWSLTCNLITTSFRRGILIYWHIFLCRSIHGCNKETVNICICNNEYSCIIMCNYTISKSVHFLSFFVPLLAVFFHISWLIFSSLGIEFNCEYLSSSGMHYFASQSNTLEWERRDWKQFSSFAVSRVIERGRAKKCCVARCGVVLMEMYRKSFQKSIKKAYAF